MSSLDGSQFDDMQWRRRLETFGPDDGPVIAAGPKGQFDGICNAGELTNKGRETTLALGQRIRHLYVEQLGFMPKVLEDADMMYLRATPIPRALESVQQAFWGMYPPSARAADFPPPTIITRTPADETLFPNDSNCRRFAKLSRAFGQRAASKWNDSDDMKYMNKLIGKWMPETSPVVKVDSHPRLSGIMDTVNATLAHGPQTKLPKEFYDKRAISILDKVNVEEWFAGYTESNEYRMVGIGGLMGDIVARMVGNVEKSGNDGLIEVGGEDGRLGQGRGGEKDIKFALSGCHDTTLAAMLASLGAFEGEKWPPYTSSIAVELFRETRPNVASSTPSTLPNSNNSEPEAKPQSWFSSFFGRSSIISPNPSAILGIARKPIDTLSSKDQAKLDDYYVRLRYNDRPMTIPGCKLPGNHLEGDETFCTLKAFKGIVDKYTPRNWKKACFENIDRAEFPAEIEPAGY